MRTVVDMGNYCVTGWNFHPIKIFFQSFACVHDDTSFYL